MEKRKLLTEKKKLLTKFSKLENYVRSLDNITTEQAVSTDNNLAALNDVEATRQSCHSGGSTADTATIDRVDVDRLVEADGYSRNTLCLNYLKNTIDIVECIVE